MIVTDPREFACFATPQRFPPRGPAMARGAFLVAPFGMTLTAESAEDNRYMAMAEHFDVDRAVIEHARLARRLSSALPVMTFPGDPATPDAVFSNNVFATISGHAIVGRMRHAIRRREAERADIRAWFTDVLRYRLIDLSRNDFVAELTGALVIDRARGLGFAGLSERCDLAGAQAMHAAFGLRLTFCFALAPGEYHTNVVMSVLGSRVLVIAPDGFADPAAAAAIARFYDHAVVTLTPAQKADYAGNCIAFGNAAWFSLRAAEALEPAQRTIVETRGFALETVDLPELEKAGGSLRCCVGEIF